MIYIFKCITWFHGGKYGRLIADEQELWKEKNDVKLPVFFALASGNLRAHMGLPWAGEGGQVLFLCMVLAGKRQL